MAKFSSNEEKVIFFSRPFLSKVAKAMMTQCKNRVPRRFMQHVPDEPGKGQIECLKISC